MEASPRTALEEASRAWLAHPRPEGGASSLWPITSGLRPLLSYSHKAVTARTHSACESRAVAWPSGPTRTTPAATQSARAGPPRPRAALIRRTAAAPDSFRCAPRVRYSTRRHMCQAPDTPGPVRQFC